ncbi:MAG TPA: 2TM domain-containing protein [Burkholderiaceae bacterium]|nr:2TM domain-containing protein [Burkholderiaceae bacterium]
MITPPLAATQERELYRRAERHVKMRLGLAVHAIVYLLVNAGLWFLNEAHGGYRWAVWPTLGWGIGLLAHATATFLVTGRQRWIEQMVRREAERLGKTG